MLVSRLVLAFFLMLFFPSCAGATGDVLTLTFTPQGCSYEAAGVLNPVLTVNWVIEDDTAQEYVYLLLTLDKGKTKSDLQDWLAQSTDHPTWATILSLDTTWESGQRPARQLDFSAHSSFDGSPVYIVCSIGEQLYVEGPVKIKD